MSVDLFHGMDAASGVCWAVAYLLIIRRGFLDRACGVPLLALAAAINWELIYAVVQPTPDLPAIVVPTWLAIDAVIVYLYLRYSEDGQSRARFAAVMAAAFAVEYSFILDFGDHDGVYSGFAVNVVMSVAFIAILERRRDVRGQSMYIALAKMAGTLVTIPHAYALHGSMWSLRVLMVITVVCDVVYAVLLGRRLRALGMRPWATWAHRLSRARRAAKRA